MLKTLHPGRFPEGPGRVSGRKTGRFSTVGETLHPRRYPEGFPEVNPEGFVDFFRFVHSRHARKGSYSRLEGLGNSAPGIGRGSASQFVWLRLALAQGSFPLEK